MVLGESRDPQLRSGDGWWCYQMEDTRVSGDLLLFVFGKRTVRDESVLGFPIRGCIDWIYM